MDKFDVIVVGLGAMGASAAMQLATRGHSVLGIDAHAPPHNLGSHHGESRIIRKAYYEHPSYVPLLDRTFALWTELAAEGNHRLMTLTGGLMIGRPDGELVSGVLESARQHKLRHTMLSPDQLADRIPVFRLDRDMVAVLEPDAGILYPETCVRLFLDRAKSKGARIQTSEAAIEWHAGADGVSVKTDRASYRASRLVLSAGAWLGQLVPALRPNLMVERQVVIQVTPRADAARFRPDQLPIFCLEEADMRFFYGIPDLGNGLKVGQHHAGLTYGSAEEVDRTVNDQDIDIVREFLARHMPHGNGPLVSSVVCLYTNTPDIHFALDYLPDEPDVVVASACSGHGFKFAPVVGEIIADLVEGKRPAFDLSMFGARRLVG
ncbi:MAG: N-methyl-L-tryptophan oxidase [Burkholderiales bacterium]